MMEIELRLRRVESEGMLKMMVMKSKEVRENTRV
jgi:hypothetical protein